MGIIHKISDLSGFSFLIKKSPLTNKMKIVIKEYTPSDLTGDPSESFLHRDSILRNEKTKQRLPWLNGDAYNNDDLFDGLQK